MVLNKVRPEGQVVVLSGCKQAGSEREHSRQRKPRLQRLGGEMGHEDGRGFRVSGGGG